jgi:hypothetical protein
MSDGNRTRAGETESMVRTWWVVLFGGLVSMCFGVTAVYLYPAMSLPFMTGRVALSLAMSSAVVVYCVLPVLHVDAAQASGRRP